jgi:hypothetical protein
MTHPSTAPQIAATGGLTGFNVKSASLSSGGLCLPILIHQRHGMGGSAGLDKIGLLSAYWTEVGMAVKFTSAFSMVKPD